MKIKLVFHVILVLFIPFILSEGFVTGTKVLTIGGYVPIERLTNNDYLMSFDVDTKQFTAAKIKRITKKWIPIRYELTYEDVQVSCAGSQLFYLKKTKTWTSVERIVSGSFAEQFQKELGIAKAGRVYDPTLVYIITLQQPHTFFITEQNRLVHNYTDALFAGGSGLATVAVAVAEGAGVVATTSLVAPLAVVTFLGYKLGKYFFAKQKDKKSNYKKQGIESNSQTNCCNDCANGNSCVKTARKNGCTSEELYERKKRAKKIIEKLNLKEAGIGPRGEKMYKFKNNKFVVLDVDCHKGGFWKMFDKRGNRIGTFDESIQIKISD